MPLPLAPPRPDPPPDVHVLLPDVFVVPGVPIRQLPAGETYLQYNSRRPPFSLAPEDLPYLLPGYPKQMGKVLLVPTTDDGVLVNKQGQHYAGCNSHVKQHIDYVT